MSSWKWELPRPPHPAGQLTSSELGSYIQELRVARDSAPDETSRTLAIAALGSAYAALSEMPEEIRPKIELQGARSLEDLLNVTHLTPDDAA